jgi:hypothetical protein
MTAGIISIAVGVVLLILLKIFAKDKIEEGQDKGIHGIEHDDMFQEDLDFDPTWSVLSSNTHHTDDD